MNLETFFNQNKGPSSSFGSKLQKKRAKKALLVQDEEDEDQELKTICKEDINCYEPGSSSSEDGSDDMPHYYKFLERTRKLNFNDGDSVSLDQSTDSKDSHNSHDFSNNDRQLAENAILGDIVDELNRSYSDCGDDAQDDEMNEGGRHYSSSSCYQRRIVDQDESIINEVSTTIVSDTESVDEPLHLFSKPRGIMAKKPRQVRLSDTIAMMKQDCNKQTAIIMVIATIIPIAGALIMIAFPKQMMAYFQSFYHWFDANPFQGFFMYALIYVIWVPITLPSSLLTVIGGFVFSMKYGGVGGFFMAWLAIQLSEPIGSYLAFVIGRYILQDYIRQTVIDKVRVFKAIDRSFSKEGLKLSTLLRVQPVIPWNILNYILAVSSCTPFDFFVGSFVGILPGTFTFLYVGVNLQNLSEIIGGHRPVSFVEILFLLVSGGSCFMLIWIISRESKKHLIQILSQDTENKRNPKRAITQRDSEGGVMIIS